MLKDDGFPMFGITFVDILNDNYSYLNKQHQELCQQELSYFWCW